MFIELTGYRTKKRNIKGIGYCCSFEEFKSDEKYDMILFYECLHHSVKPWKILEQLSKFLNDDGVFVLAGEPFINSDTLPNVSYKWKDWGIRTDSMSTYCIRKYGWFENGFTLDFMKKCFERIDFNMKVFPNIGLDNGIICTAMHKSSKKNITSDLLLPSYLMKDKKKIIERLNQAEQKLISMQNSKLFRTRRMVKKYIGL